MASTPSIGKKTGNTRPVIAKKSVSHGQDPATRRHTSAAKTVRKLGPTDSDQHVPTRETVRSLESNAPPVITIIPKETISIVKKKYDTFVNTQGSRLRRMDLRRGTGGIVRGVAKPGVYAIAGFDSR